MAVEDLVDPGPQTSTTALSHANQHAKLNDLVRGGMFVGPTKPNVPAGHTYAWVQTGINGTDLTLWIEDGT